MKNFIYPFLLAFIFASCSEQIKNTETKVLEEEGTEVENADSEKALLTKLEDENAFIGNWVGYFEPDNVRENDGKGLVVDDGFYWGRENKINIMIQKMEGDKVTGRSIIAGNDRPFTGTKTKNKFRLKEPGDDKHDGEFNFTIEKDELTGKWVAYKKINIEKRKYALHKKEFRYDKDIILERSIEYVNWLSFKSEKVTDEFEGEIAEWMRKEFSTSTDAIYKINASNTLLTKKQVENLKKGDLTIIRNAIYARHGYSFKNRPLRVFFDAQTWYIPMSTNIKSELTELEKENIKLLLRYEKNASEYYDYFGRG